MTIEIISIRDCINIEVGSKEKFVFVIAPFDQDRSDVYNTIIKPVVEKKGYECKRADDFTTNTTKINDIVRNIWKSQFIIADLTRLRPNVMYELGFSHAMNKETILIYEENIDKTKEEKFPFDINHIERIIYKSGSTTEGVKLEKKLEKAVDYVIENLTKSVMSDIKDFYFRKEEMEYKQIIISNFEIRKKRIHYFTYHIIKNLIYFKNENYKLNNLLNECIKETKEDNIRKIRSNAKNMSIFNDYIMQYEH